MLLLKKITKIFLVVVILFGIVVSTLNFISTSTEARIVIPEIYCGTVVLTIIESTFVPIGCVGPCSSCIK